MAKYYETNLVLISESIGKIFDSRNKPVVIENESIIVAKNYKKQAILSRKYLLG